MAMMQDEFLQKTGNHEGGINGRVEQTYDELVLSRAEKGRALLQHLGKKVKVLGLGYRLGSHEPLPDVGFEESRLCRVIGCTSHHVTLEDTLNAYTFSEPLANVTIARDHEQAVPLLVVAPSHRA
jgi:hypothetical protein